MDKKIVILGYMGSGKSAVGQKLSELTKLKLVDLDRYIEGKEGMVISEIFQQKGEIWFRKKEREYLEFLLAQKDAFILSLGGGTPCFGNTMEYLQKSDVITIYLKASVITLTQRLSKEKSHRPLLASLTNVDLEEFIRKHLFERNFYYMQAQKVISVDDRSVEDIASEILQKAIG